MKYRVPNILTLEANFSTEDNRITKGKEYEGYLVSIRSYMSIDGNPGLRYLVFDNQKSWMTFAPKAFKVLATSKLTLNQTKAKSLLED